MRRILRYDVVISYSNTDWRYLVQLDKFLRSSAARVFSAPRDVDEGKDWKEQFKLKTKDCDLFIPLISLSSLKKGIVHQEIGLAEGQDKEIFPIIIGKSKFSEKSLGFLHNKLYIRWTDEHRNTKILKKLLKGYRGRLIGYAILLVIVLLIVFK